MVGGYLYRGDIIDGRDCNALMVCLQIIYSSYMRDIIL